MDVLCGAALFADSENAKGVTASVMMGQLASFGTGDVEIHLPCKEVRVERGRAGRALRCCQCGAPWPPS